MILKLAAVAIVGILLGVTVRAPAVLAATFLVAFITLAAGFVGKVDLAAGVMVVAGIIVFQLGYLIGVFSKVFARSLCSRRARQR